MCLGSRDWIILKSLNDRRELKLSHTPHELTSEFPDHTDRIHTLRLENAHFAKLSDQYHSINREIHRGETNIEPMDDLHLEDLKKQRLALLDEITEFLN